MIAVPEEPTADSAVSSSETVIIATSGELPARGAETGHRRHRTRAAGWLSVKGAVLHGDDFPIVGSQHRSWCGQTIMVIGLTLNARDLPRSCAECNQQLRMMATTQRAR